MKANLSEKAIENSILHWLSWKGYYAWKTKTTGTYDQKRGRFLKPSPLYRTGISDIVGLFDNGRIFCIEVKSRKGKTQPNQDLFLSEIKKRGGLAFVARSIEDVEEQFKLETK